MVFTLVAASNARKVGGVALLLGFVGGLFIAWAAGAFLKGSQDEAGRNRERIRTLIGGLLVAAAFLLLFVTRIFLH